MAGRFQYKPKFVDIRVKPPKEGEDAAEDVLRLKPGERPCEWPECRKAATARAPKSREHLQEHYHFCQGHAGEYNKGWDFFAGMTDAQVRAARTVLGAPDGQIFRADSQSVLAEIMASAHELDASLAGIDTMTEAQQREALPVITPQVEQLITTTDTACRTSLRTRAKTRSGQLNTLSGDIDFEAASLATYERDRNDLTL